MYPSWDRRRRRECNVSLMGQKAQERMKCIPHGTEGAGENVMYPSWDRRCFRGFNVSLMGQKVLRRL
jgi:hypothetical protein